MKSAPYDRRQPQRCDASPATAAAPLDGLHELKCAITHAAMSNPAVAADGITYEYKAIKRWLAHSPNARSPFTNGLLPHRWLTPNFALRHVIEHLNTECRLDPPFLPHVVTYVPHQESASPTRVRTNPQTSASPTRVRINPIDPANLVHPMDVLGRNRWCVAAFYTGLCPLTFVLAGRLLPLLGPQEAPHAGQPDMLYVASGVVCGLSMCGVPPSWPNVRALMGLTLPAIVIGAHVGIGLGTCFTYTTPGLDDYVGLVASAPPESRILCAALGAAGGFVTAHQMWRATFGLALQPLKRMARSLRRPQQA